MLEVIRPDFIRGYSQMMTVGWEERNRLIRERDALHEALNHEFGVKSSSSFHGQPDRSYDKRYKEIDSDFRPKYEAVTTHEEAWKRDQEMTIPEDLLVDSASPELKMICARRDFADLHYSTFIRAKAELYLARWKTEFNLAGLQQRVKSEANLFTYAAQRCREWHGVRFWQREPNMQIARYRRRWVESLNESLGWLSAA